MRISIVTVYINLRLHKHKKDNVVLVETTLSFLCCNLFFSLLDKSTGVEHMFLL